MWKDIEGWENFYEVSSEGLVRNKSTNKLITIDYSNKSGYARVTLYYKGRRERFLLHRLVMKTFVGESNLEVNHIDSDKCNNSLSNLEYVTRKDNEMHCLLYGAKRNLYKPFKIIYFNGDIDVFQVKGELANRLGVTRACIKNWLHGKTRGYLNYNIKEIHYIEVNKCQTTNCSA